MGMYKYLNQLWKQPSEAADAIWKQRMIDWRAEDAVVRVEHPTRLDRARTLGYKAKPGFVLARVRVPRGGRARRDRAGGRKHHSAGRTGFTPKKSKQWIAEERAAKKFVNLEVLNSYEVGRDGKHLWYEIVLVDPSHPAIQKDGDVSWISRGVHGGRVYRGLTSAGRRSRGMRSYGRGAEKVRPSQNRHYG